AWKTPTAAGRSVVTFAGMLSTEGSPGVARARQRDRQRRFSSQLRRLAERVTRDARIISARSCWRSRHGPAARLLLFSRGVLSAVEPPRGSRGYDGGDRGCY